MIQLFQIYISIFIINLLNYIKAHMSQNLIINNYRIPFNNVTVVLVLSIFAKLNIESVNLQNYLSI